MAMENGRFEDVFPVENGDFLSIAMLVYWRVNHKLVQHIWGNKQIVVS